LAEAALRLLWRKAPVRVDLQFFQDEINIHRMPEPRSHEVLPTLSIK
jgi:hypothetical protein